MGGRRVYVTISSSQPVSHQDTLASNYFKISDCTNFKTGKNERVFMKELIESSTDKLTIKLSENVIDLEEDVVDGNLVLSENFGLFIRDSEGEIKGVSGALLKSKQSTLTYTLIDFLLIVPYVGQALEKNS